MFSCPFQHEEYVILESDIQSIVTHLLTAHDIRIENIEEVTLVLDKYIESCKDRSFSAHGPHFLGGDLDLRKKLHAEKLVEMLNIQAREREDGNSQIYGCLFCRIECTGRHEFFDHLNLIHSFNIGHLDNLVKVDEFIEILRHQLASLKCLYCEKTFTSSAVLRKHMRKKKHFMVNPENSVYDQFYMINYLEPGKNWKGLSKEQDIEDSQSENWSGWDADDCHAICLFCPESFSNPVDLIENHMAGDHGFDLKSISIKLNLDFYDNVRLCNYIRRKNAECICFICEESFDSNDSLMSHLFSDNHIQSIPGRNDASFWQDSRYLWPTLEEDTLLQYVDFEDVLK